MTHMQIYTEIKQNKKGIKMQDKTEVFNEILEKEKIFDGTVVPADVIVAIYKEKTFYAIHKPKTAINKKGKLCVAPFPKWTGKHGDDIDNIKVHLTSNNEIPVGMYEEIVYTPDDITFITFVAKKAPKKSEVKAPEQSDAVIIHSSEDEHEKWEEESDDEAVQMTEPKIKLEVLADKEADEAKKEAEKKAAEEAEEKEAAAKKEAEEAAAKKEAEEAEKNILMQEYKVAKEALSAHLQETHKKTNIMQKELYNILYKLVPVYKPPVEGLKELNRPMDPKTTNSAFGFMRSDPENLPELEKLHTMALIDMFDDNKPINNRNIPGKMEGYYKLWALDNEPKANAFKTAAEKWNEKHQLDKATHKAKHAINAMPKVAEKAGSTDIYSTVFAMGSVKKTETQKGKTVEKRKPGSSKTAPVKRAKTGKGAKSKEDDSDDNIFLDPSDEGGEQDE